MPRKTVRVADLTHKINERLASPDTSANARAELSELLTQVLSDADCYFGFNYLPSEWLSLTLTGAPGREAHLREALNSYPPSVELQAEVDALRAKAADAYTKNDTFAGNGYMARMHDLLTPRDDYRRVYY